MSGPDFAAFVSLCKQRRGWSKTELSKRLGCGINQINIWAAKGAPPYIDLACAALDRDIGVWSGRHAQVCAISTDTELARAPGANVGRGIVQVETADAPWLASQASEPPREGYQE